MPSIKTAKHSIEILEQRIAPAGLLNEAGFKQATFGANLLHAGQGLTTGNGAGSGQYLIYVQSGSAMVFITDLNNNSTVDPNEITGVAAGDGLSLISFVDIHGDIVTDLTPSDKLSDSDHNPSNNDPSIGGDGRVLLNSSINQIVLRSVQASDFTLSAATDSNGDGQIDQSYIDNRLALSNYSIFGNILAGKSFGTATGGLIIDDSGSTEQATKFNGTTSVDYYIKSQPSIGSILTGTKAGGKYFSFGISSSTDTTGYLTPFNPVAGQIGGDITGVKAVLPQTTFNINSIESGDGGIGARGGNIQGIVMNGDSGGYQVIAGNGGRGPVGGVGGSVIGISDLGSVTGYVLVKSGDGGVGSTGTGGAAGTVTFGTMNLAAGLHVELGNGGNGFTSGGNGSSLPSGTITTPEGAVPYGLNITATMHTPLSIGSTAIVDFNGDGIADYVYTTTAPDQIVVVLGNKTNIDAGLLGGGTKIYLNGPRNVSAVTIGDFNDDGHPDIAVASQDEGNAGGITVFLSQYNSTNTSFTGFELPRYSPLPTLNKTETATPGWTRSANSITSLVAGDFTGDGHTDIAVIATYTNTVNLIQDQVLLFMKNDVEAGKATGRFYGDFGAKGSGLGLTPYVGLNGSIGRGGAGSFIAKGSAASVNDLVDTVFVANAEADGNLAKVITTYQLQTSLLTGLLTPVQLGAFGLGQVDTNRNLKTPKADNETDVDALSLDFTILDFGSPPTAVPPAMTPDPGALGAADGVADLAVLASNGYVVTLVGDPMNPGSSGFTASDPNGGDNSGIYFGKKGFDVGTALKAIRTTDTNNDGVFDQIAVLNYSGNNNGYSVNGVSIAPPAAPGTPNLANGLGTDDGDVAFGVLTRDNTVVAFDTYHPSPTGANTTSAYLIAEPTKNPIDAHAIIETGNGINLINPNPPGGFTFPFNFTTTFLTDNTISISAGNGGNALIGKGGTGGFIGGGLNSLNITLPKNPAFSSTIVLEGGSGGNGFSTGGAGGGVTGVTERYTAGTTVLYANATLVAGDGGFGVSGAGGAGGSLALNSIASGEFFQGGDGGRGNVGGAGGSVTGNGAKNFYDSSDVSVEVHAGAGGSGVTKGGVGGSVSNFRVQYITPIGGTRGEIYYTGGDGGNAASGPGGAGGSIVNSSPLDGVNAMSGEIFLSGGNGGIGTVGGAGGSISNFHDNPSVQNNPTIVSILAGNGGAGTSGNGGVGGGIANVSAPSTGTLDNAVLLSGYLFDRIIAGSGGNSASANGGAGGSITSTSVSSSDGAIAFIAGAGGNGLVAGGAGGSVIGSDTTNGAASESKVLVVAGAGGDAYAFITNPLDNPATPAQKPFGGKVGQGGNGGSITGFTQSIAVQAKVDLIAGNGGSTVNYGTVTTAKSFVGKGGSITNTVITGNIGSGHAKDMTDPSLVGNPALPAPGLTELGLKANVPIKSYTDLDGNGVDDETFNKLVQDNFRFKPDDAFTPFVLDDSVGNVGAIVGAAGRIKTAETSPGIFTSQPAKGGVNGSLTNVSARNLLAAVAGSVNQIAAIQTVSGLKIGSGTGANFLPGIVGSDKDPTRNPYPQSPDPLAIGDPTPGSIFDYVDANGQGVVEAQLDGRLIDGAVVAQTVTGFISGRVFLR